MRTMTVITRTHTIQYSDVFSNFVVHNFDTILLVRKQQLASLTYGVRCAVFLFRDTFCN